MSCFPLCNPTRRTATENPSVGCRKGPRRPRLNRPAHRTNPPPQKLLKTLLQLLRPAHTQMPPHLPPQSPQPMTLARRVAPGRPPPLTYPVQQTSPDLFNASLYPPPVSRRTHPYHHPTLRTAIPLKNYRHSASFIEVRPDKTVPPYPHSSAARTPLRAPPGIIPPQSLKGLDAQIDEEYQEIALGLWGIAPPGEGEWPNVPFSPSLPFLQNEKASLYGGSS